MKNKEEQIAKNQGAIALITKWQEEPWTPSKQAEFENWYREFTMANLGGDLVNLRDYQDGYNAAIDSVFVQLKNMHTRYHCTGYKKHQRLAMKELFEFIDKEFTMLYRTFVMVQDL